MHSKITELSDVSRSLQIIILKFVVIRQENFINSFANHLLIETKNFCTYDIECFLHSYQR